MNHPWWEYRRDQQFSFPDGLGHRMFIDCYGIEEYLIAVGLQTIRFTWSDRFGPLPITRRGGEITLRHNHPFWRAASIWSLQGKRLVGDKAIWHEPKKPVLRHMGGKHYEVIEAGESGHDW